MGKRTRQINFSVYAGDQHLDVFAKTTDGHNSDGKTLI